MEHLPFLFLVFLNTHMTMHMVTIGTTRPKIHSLYWYRFSLVKTPEKKKKKKREVEHLRMHNLEVPLSLF